jgi:hypothetical protein
MNPSAGGPYFAYSPSAFFTGEKALEIKETVLAVLTVFLRPADH